MRMIISMKKINSDNWVPRNRRDPHVAPYVLTITNPPLVSVDNLYYSFYLYNDDGGLAMFYTIVALPLFL
jgi:hypothetical protein